MKKIKQPRLLVIVFMTTITLIMTKLLFFSDNKLNSKLTQKSEIKQELINDVVKTKLSNRQKNNFSREHLYFGKN